MNKTLTTTRINGRVGFSRRPLSAFRLRSTLKPPSHGFATPLLKGDPQNSLSIICSSFSGSVDSPSVVTLITQIASASAWAAAAWLGYQLVLQQDAASKKGQKECERCQGTGYVECFCTRWSDSKHDNSGCSTCRGTKKMICNSCNGGGTAVPIEARLYIDPARNERIRNF